jgi:hypothetical protein
VSSTPARRRLAIRSHAALLVRRTLLLALLGLLPSPARAVTYQASNGRIVYGVGATSPSPSSNTYTASSTFGAAAQLPPGAAGQASFVLKSSPLHGSQYLAGYVTTGGVLYVLRYDGSAWTTEWSASVGGDGVNGRRFDIAYEKATGRGLVVYSANAAGAALHYRTWDPTSPGWGPEQAVSSALLSGVASSVKLASDVGSSRIALAVVDTSSALTALVWSGSSWGSEPSYPLSSSPLYYSSTVGDSESFDLAFGSSSGDLTVAWGANPSAPVLCVNRLSSGTWLASTYVFPLAGIGSPVAGLQVALAADPLSDKLGLVYVGKSWGSPYLAGYVWSGTGWSSNLSFGTYGGFAGGTPHTRAFSALWLDSGNYPALLVPLADSSAATGKLSYSIAFLNSTQTDWTSSTGSASVAWPWATGTAQKLWIQAQTDPGLPTIGMVVFADSKGSLWAKAVTAVGGGPGYAPGLTWTNADGGAALTGALATTTSQGFAFDFARPPLTIFGDNTGVEAPTGVAVCPNTSNTLYDVDRFTLLSTGGKDTVTGLYFTVTSGNQAVGYFEITSDDGATVYQTGYAPYVPYQISPGNYYAQNVNLPVTSTPTQFRLKVVPANVSSIPAGLNYTIAAQVTRIEAATNQTTGSDPSSGSVIVLRAAPPDPVWGTVSALPGQGVLNWSDSGSNYASTVILRSAAGSTVTNTSLTDGTAYAPGTALAGTPTDTVIYGGNGASLIDSSGNGGGTYFYRAFAADACGNYSTGVTTAAALTVPPVPNATTAGTLSATVGSCSGVTLTASFTGDGNGDNAATFTRNGAAFTCASKTRSPPQNGTVGGNSGTWTCIDAVPSSNQNQSLTYGVSLADADGVSGSSPSVTVTETPCVSSNGRIAFSPGTASANPASSQYGGQGTTNAFGPAVQLPPGAAGQTFFVLRASPIRDEYLAGYVTSAGVLYVLRYDGASWRQEWSATVGGDGVNGRRFDLAYEKVSGRGMVVYSGNGGEPSVSLRYRIWNPSTGHWGTEQAFGTLQLFGTVNWVKLAARPNANQLAVAAMDATNSYLTALLWDGSSWGNEPSYALSPYNAGASPPHSLSYLSIAGDLEVFDLAFTSASGDLLLAWSALDVNYNYYDLYTNRFQAASGSWLPQTAVALGANTRYWQVVLAPDPQSDQVGVVFSTYTGTGTYLSARIWTGSGWIPYTVQNSHVFSKSYSVAQLTSAAANQLPFTAFWLRIGGTSALVVPYALANTANKMSFGYLLNSAFTLGPYGQSFSPWSFTSGSATINWPQSSTDAKVWFQGVTDLASLGRAMVVFSDSKGALWAKRLVLSNGPTFTWSDAEGSTAPLTSSLAQPPRARNFGFAYDHPPVTVFGDNAGLEAVTGSPACAASATSAVLYDLDHFTLATSSNSWPNGTDTVTGVTVEVATGNAAVGALYVTSDTGAVLGSLGYQASGSYAIPVTIPVTTTATQYRVQVKPAPPSALPSGASYTIAASVVGIAARNPVGGSDPTRGSVVVDRVAPAAPVWGAASSSPGQVSLAWTNPGSDYANTVVLRSASGQPPASSSPTDGSGYAQGQLLGGDTVAYSGSGTAAADLSGAGTFVYRAFAADACNNYSAGATTAAQSVPAVPGPTTAMGLTAGTSSCTGITLVASFTGDGDGDNGVSFTRDGQPIQCASLTRSGSGNGGRWTCADAVPSANATYSYAASFTDPDGVAGPSPLTASVVQTACPAAGGTLSLGAHPLGTSPSASASPGQTEVLAGRFSLTASPSNGGSVPLTGIVLRSAGSAGGADVASLQIHADVGAVAGSWDPGDQLVGAANWSPSAGAWVASGFTVPAGTTSYLVTLSPAYGATPGRTFALSFSTADVTGGPGVSVVGAQAITGGTVTISSAPAGQKSGDPATGSLKPMVLILAPGNGTTASLDAGASGKGVRVQVQVYDPSHTSIGSVKLSHDAGATFPDSLSLNPKYDPVVNPAGQVSAHVYQADLATIPPGSWTLQAMAVTAGGGAGYSAPISVTVAAPGSGDGNLLVRSDSNQLCLDCHALPTHSSQSVSSASGISKYGSWATNCRDCHTPHRTRNAQLLAESIVPPAYGGYQTAKPVRFWDRKTGDSGTASAVSFVSSSAPASGLLGPCQACHTRTGGGIARWRNTGNSDSHFSGASTQACTTCHTHANGFGGQESLGGQSCGTCHSSKFWNMQAQGTPAPAMPRLTKHTLGTSVQGTNDSPQNPALAWGNPLSANAPADRSCVGMCHADHVHNDPATWPAASHASNLYVNGATQASRALTRDGSVLDSGTYGFATSASTGSLVTASDFAPGQYGQGCLACHTNPVDSRLPGLSGAAYDSSAHNVGVTPAGVPWEYVLHDGSRFVRNCTKCHAGTQVEGQAVSYRGAVQGVHYSDNSSLLAGAVRPAGNAASSVCYNCHGNGVVGVNASNKAIASEFAKPGSAHPANADGVHDTVAEASLAWGNALGTNSAATRHANCLDCHAPHVAQRSLTDARVIGSAVSGAVAGPAIAGATGAKLTSLPLAWTAPTAANFAVVTSITPGVDGEATLCFKCHSSFYWGTDSAKIPTSPSGGFQETDVAMEFNPANASFHPVLAQAPNPTPNILRPWTTTSRMRCTDCHASDATTDPDGPHGSAARYLLKGPNTDWSADITMGNRGKYKIFCANCHDVNTFNYTLSLAHTYGAGAHTNARCFTCHAAVPHGGPRPGLVVAEAGVAAGLPVQTSYDTAAPYFQGGYIPQFWDNGVTTGLYIRSYPSAGVAWSEADCSCNQPNYH